MNTGVENSEVCCLHNINWINPWPDYALLEQEKDFLHIY